MRMIGRPASVHSSVLKRWPLVKVASSPRDLTSQPQSALSGRVLVAEDNAVNQKVALAMLGKLGYEATVVVNGALAVAAVQTDHYDVVLMDMQMPVLDGLAATREIRALDDVEQPWIIALTANAMVSDQEACFAAGMNDYVAKPIRTDFLADAMERAEAARLPGTGAQAA